jgi:hypothetical protein
MFLSASSKKKGKREIVKEKQSKPCMITKINSESTQLVDLSKKIIHIPNYYLFFLPFHSIERTTDGLFYVLKMDAIRNKYIAFDDFFCVKPSLHRKIHDDDKIKERIGKVIASYKYLLNTLQIINAYNIDYMNLTCQLYLH